MRIPAKLRRSTSGLTTILLMLLGATAFLARPTHADEIAGSDPYSAIDDSGGVIRWNLSNTQVPLLSLPRHFISAFDLSFTFPLEQFGIPLFQSLHYNPQSKNFLLMLTSDGGRRAKFMDLSQVGKSRVYRDKANSNIQLLDQGNIKTLRTSNGTQYSFLWAADGELRCAQISLSGGNLIRLSYNTDGLINSLVDGSGRTIDIKYSNDQVNSLTQTWSVESIKMMRSWRLSEINASAQLPKTGPTAELKFGPRFGSVKVVPTNALTPDYTREMAESDHVLAQVFGGPGSVAAANGFEPSGLSTQYPFYRGAFRVNDGSIHLGHLSYAMHLYGSEDGTETTSLYVPAGFISHSNTPTPTDAAITFYYPHLGNLSNVTVAVFHVANFSLSYEGERVRIGNIGGPGGSYQYYKHSHIEFYRGNTGLPAASARGVLRISPASVFATSDSTRMRTVARR